MFMNEKHAAYRGFQFLGNKIFTWGKTSIRHSLNRKLHANQYIVYNIDSDRLKQYALRHYLSRYYVSCEDTILSHFAQKLHKFRNVFKGTILLFEYEEYTIKI